MSEEEKLDSKFMTILHVQATSRTTFAVRGLVWYLVHIARIASVEPSPEILYCETSFPRWPCCQRRSPLPLVRIGRQPRWL